MSTPLSQTRARLPRLAEAAAERARLTVVPRGGEQAPQVPFVALVSLLLVGGVAGLLLFNTNLQQASFVASSMEQQAAVLAGKEESLRMQLHRLRDPQHVAVQARRLGMVPARNPAFIRLSDGKVLGRPAPAEPSDALRVAPVPAVKPSSLRPRLVIAEVPRPRRDRAGDRGEGAGDRGEGAGSRSRAAQRRTTDGDAGTAAAQSTQAQSTQAQSGGGTR
jgi:hypothetical protein